MDAMQKLAIQQLHTDLSECTAAIKELTDLLKAQSKDGQPVGLPVTVVNIDEFEPVLTALALTLIERLDAGIAVEPGQKALVVEQLNG